MLNFELPPESTEMYEVYVAQLKNIADKLVVLGSGSTACWVCCWLRET